MKTLYTILLISFSFSALGTSQAADKLTYNGKKGVIFSFLLESYFYKYPNIKPACKKSEIITYSSGCVRGYVAYYTIENNKLFLSNIKIQCNGWQSVMLSHFKKKRIHMNWYSGSIIMPLGKVIDEINEPIFKRYQIIEIVDGVCKRSYKMNRKSYIKFQNEKWRKYISSKKYTFDFGNFKNNEYTSTDKEDVDFYLRYVCHQYFNH